MLDELFSIVLDQFPNLCNVSQVKKVSSRSQEQTVSLQVVSV